jgi:hypothetical protein
MGDIESWAFCWNGGVPTVEHRNPLNVLLALALLKGYARLWCKQVVQRPISALISKGKVFIWFLISNNNGFVVFYPVMMAWC